MFAYNNSVSIVTRLRAEGPGNRVSIPGRGNRIFPFLQRCVPARPNQPITSMGTGDFYSGNKTVEA
jgi:hypothetical protein